MTSTKGAHPLSAAGVGAYTYPWWVQEREVRFGVRQGWTHRSSTFVVSASTNTDDVYVLSREVGRQFRVSLHQSPSWRLSLGPDRQPGEAPAPGSGAVFHRPPPFAPGLTKAFAVIVPTGGVRVPLTSDFDPNIRLYNVPPGAKGVQFSLIYTAPGVLTTPWPGADGMTATMSGKFVLPNSGETAWVLAHALHAVPKPDPMVIPPQDPATTDEIVRVAGEGTLRALVFGRDRDGMHFIYDSSVASAEVSTSPSESG